jgi:hypothetical protein
MQNKTLYIPEGVPNIQSLFPTVDFNNVEEYFITVFDALSGAFDSGFSNGFDIGTDGGAIATTRINKLDSCCCEDKVRIHFVNSLGEIDTINFSRPDEILEIKSDTWEKALKFPLDRTKGGTTRQGIKSNETIEAETKCYPETDQYWIKELFQAPMAWIETYLPNGFNTPTQKELIPIEILDAKFPIRKVEQRYEYLVKIKFSMANSNINLR